ncbi:hypothetical protein N802_07455 [Knoellia sinensis KCTC 19936]|uniref:Uncharacterized protein n=1 Tax=Knoellia sinensis KCTC 19936 TaxID=1385520 RepID=A0A0A0JCB3_9MICO|nr:hypothetical protein [Knoellia sinensis]KGN33647.1 hypothetical protein N802_07455 [Knoellia sinensis KCTC 19936]
MSGSPIPAPRQASINVTRLLAEAASKSGVLWVEVPDAGTHAVWFVWHDDEDPRGTGPAAYVVSGHGEQTLPDLPDVVTVILRSKDTGGRILRLRASVREVDKATPEWDEAAEILRSNRLNATGDVLARWREGATIHVLAPHGIPEEGPGTYAAESGRVTVSPARGTTARWRPWHWRGRGRD